jgi:hypothetical protein
MLRSSLLSATSASHLLLTSSRQWCSLCGLYSTPTTLHSSDDTLFPLDKVDALLWDLMDLDLTMTRATVSIWRRCSSSLRFHGCRLDGDSGKCLDLTAMLYSRSHVSRSDNDLGERLALILTTTLTLVNPHASKKDRSIFFSSLP